MTGRPRVLVALDEPRAPDEPPMSGRSSLARKAANPALVDALRAHIQTVQGENEALREQLAAERDRSMKTLAAFSDIAARLDALAAERERRSWCSGDWLA